MLNYIDILFFSSDDDAESFDSDDDSYASAAEDDPKERIFVSLRDSHVIGRLSFHQKDEPTGFVLPRPKIGGLGETYEEVYRLLEEVELLLKTWRRRVGHPYTAHISRDTPSPQVC